MADSDASFVLTDNGWQEHAEEGFRLSVHTGGEPLSPSRFGHDFIVEVDRGRWGGTFFTPEHVAERMDHWSRSDESAGGAYFWAAGLLIVRDLRGETLVETIRDLIKCDYLQLALQPMADDEQGASG